MTPSLDRIDHLHVFVADRLAATAWYGRVLGLLPIAGLAHWAGGGGPLTLGNATGAVHIALFERPPQPCRSTVAFGVTADEFQRWKAHLRHATGQTPALQDHGGSLSLYFSDPDGNPFEITCTDSAARRAARLTPGPPAARASTNCEHHAPAPPASTTRLKQVPPAAPPAGPPARHGCASTCRAGSPAPPSHAISSRR